MLSIFRKPAQPNPAPTTRNHRLRALSSQVLALLLAAAATLLAARYLPALVGAMDNHVATLAWRVLPERAAERRFVLVDIDEQSLREVGPWPWPRERVADLADRLKELGAGVVAFDVVFSESRPGDDVLASRLQGMVLAQVFSFPSQSADPAVGTLRGALAAPACAPPLPAASGYIGTAETLPASAAGHISPRLSSDGVIRHLWPLVCYEGQAYPVLALAALLQGTHAAPELDLARGRTWLEPDWILQSRDLPGWAIPMEAGGDALVPYRRAREAFVSVSAADVIAGRVPRDLFADHWILIGATALGAGDAVPTPLGGRVAGVEVHAQFLSALLDNRLPYTPRGAHLLQSVAAGLAAILLLAAAHTGRARAWLLPMTGLLLAVLFMGAQVMLLRLLDWMVGWTLPGGFAMLAATLLAATSQARLALENHRVRSHLSAYLPAPVASTLALSPPSERIDASRKGISVVFADLRNFAALCESAPPELAARVLHEFYGLATRIVEAHHGVVEAFRGDAVMAVWNAHSASPDPEHTLHAYTAARILAVETDALLAAMSLPPDIEKLGIGVGMESGEALVGSFGPLRRRLHTALGHPITVAERLQGLTAELAHPVLVGPGAAQHLGASATESLGDFLLMGLTQPTRVYTPAPYMPERPAGSPPSRLRLVTSARHATH